MLAHRSTEAGPGARGHAFGRAHRDAIGHTVAVYRRLLGELAEIGGSDLPISGTRVGEVLAAHWPDLLEEIESIAAGAAQPAAVLLAVNARTELLAGTPATECSLIGQVSGGRCRIAQNWDWHPELRRSLVCWTVCQPGGRWFTTVTEAGIVAKLGLSSPGLCVGLNFLSSSLDVGVGGVPVHVLLRVLLDRCDTIVDALRVLRDATMRSSGCITVGSADGGEAALVSAELSPAGCELLWPDADGRLCHTNHFVLGVRGGADLEPDASPSTLVRRWRLSAAPADAPIESALRSHLGAPEAICRHEVAADPWAERRATLASLVMDVAPPALRIADGAPCEHPWKDVSLP